MPRRTKAENLRLINEAIERKRLEAEAAKKRAEEKAKEEVPDMKTQIRDFKAFLFEAKDEKLMDKIHAEIKSYKGAKGKKARSFWSATLDETLIKHRMLDADKETNGGWQYILALCQDYIPEMENTDILAVMPYIDKFVRITAITDNTVVTHMNVIKNLLKTKFGDEWPNYARNFGLTMAEYKERKKKQAEILVKKHSDVKVVKENDIDEVFKKIGKSIKTTYQDSVIQIALSIGARKIEILNKDVAEFEKVDKHTILQKGLAKANKDAQVKRPILGPLDADQIIAMVKFVRRYVESKKYVKMARAANKPVSEVNQLLTKDYDFNYRLNQRIVELFPETASTNSNKMHHLRKIYVNLLHAKLPETEENKSLLKHISDILGHKNLNDSSVHYNTLKIMTKPKADDVLATYSKKELEDLCERIQEKLKLEHKE